MYRWRQYTAYLNLQNTRHYTPSSRCLVSKPLPYKPRVSRAPQTEGPRRQPSFNFNWLDWAKNHKFIVFCVCFFGYPIVQSFRTLQRVPITGRIRLDYIPKWLGTYLETEERELEDERQKENIQLGSESPIMQGPTSIINALLRASGLDDDREWELRVFNAPGEQAIAYSHMNVCALTNAPRRQQNKKNRCLEIWILSTNVNQVCPTRDCVIHRALYWFPVVSSLMK